MRKMKLFSVVVVIFLLIAPVLSSAETEQECVPIDITNVLPPQSADLQIEERESNSLHILAQMDEYIPCYKVDDKGRTVFFRWCRKTFPWTPTNEMRNFCYATSEDCAKAEMPQSWCIKCGEKW